MRSLGFHPCITSTCERHPSLTSASPRPPPQPRVREPVGYHSQVQPEHLQAVLPRVRQGHRLREGACRVEQSRPNPLRLFSGAFPPIRRRFEPSRRPRDARVPPRRRSGSFEPRAQRASRRTPFRGSSATARHPETQTDLSSRSFFSTRRTTKPLSTAHVAPGSRRVGECVARGFGDIYF